ncbi:hypothetical protein [Pseudoramibacter faecis]|nr:hypothetical protein [Pseudoramibacter sp. HA2172]
MDFPKTFRKEPDSLTEFSLDAFNGLVAFITVYSDKDIRVTFRTSL